MFEGVTNEFQLTKARFMRKKSKFAQTKIQSRYTTKTEDKREKQNADIKTPKTMDKQGIYIPHVSLLYYSLITQDLSANTIQGVVRNVLEHTLTMDVENISLPSRATAQRMVAEAGELARIRAFYELALKKGTIRHHSDKKTKSQQIH